MPTEQHPRPDRLLILGNIWELADAQLEKAKQHLPEHHANVAARAWKELNEKVVDHQVEKLKTLFIKEGSKGQEFWGDSIDVASAIVLAITDRRKVG